jgi:hypothetical protein
MLTDTNALRLLARYMNNQTDLDGAVDSQTWMEVAPLLQSMQIVGQPYWEVAPIRSGCAIYWITDCCSLQYLSLFDQCDTLYLEANVFCMDCWRRVFDELWYWRNLTQLHLQVNSRLHDNVLDHIEMMWQGDNQLTDIVLGDILVSQENEERIVAAFGNLRVFNHTFPLPRNMR